MSSTSLDTARTTKWAVWLLAAVILLEASLYSSLTPLLPRIMQQLTLDKGAAGVLYSAYMIGSVLGALLGPLIIRVAGRRLTVRLALVMMALTNIGFALSDGYVAATAFRFGTGFAGGIAWVTTMTWLLALSSSNRRGAAVGAAMGISVFGTLAGPLIGNAATAFGLPLVFGLVSLLCLTIAVVLPPSTIVAAPVENAKTSTDNRNRRRWRTIAGSMWLMGLLAFTYGALFVLLPIRLAAVGISELWLGWIFAIASALSAIVNRVAGIAVDRFGLSKLTIASLCGGTVVLALLALQGPPWLSVLLVLLAVGIVFALGISPAAAAIAFDADDLRLSGATASMIMLIVFSGGEAVGGIIVPIAAQATSDSATFLLLGLITAASVAVAWRTARTRALDRVVDKKTIIRRS